jgi:hypothetical protein
MPDVDTVEPTAVGTPPPPPSTRPEPPGGLGGGGNQLTRVTVNLTPRALAALERLSGRTGASKTDLINRGLQVLELIENMMEEDDGSLTVQRKDGAIRQLYLM